MKLVLFDGLGGEAGRGLLVDDRIIDTGGMVSEIHEYRQSTWEGGIYLSEDSTYHGRRPS